MRQVGKLVSIWWRVDAIRVSPRQGRLLRLRPGTLLRVGDQHATVVARRVCQGSDGPVVIYDCLVDERPGELRVPMSQGQQSTDVDWSHTAGCQRLPADDVEVFGAPT